MNKLLRDRYHSISIIRPKKWSKIFLIILLKGQSKELKFQIIFFGKNLGKLRKKCYACKIFILKKRILRPLVPEAAGQPVWQFFGHRYPKHAV